MLSRALILAAAATVCAQVGTGWNQYWPNRKIHLDNAAGLQVYDWTPQKSVGCADYSFDEATGIETFRLLQGCTNRSEIRLQNEYKNGKRQFEGEVRVSSPTNDESVMQVFGGSAGGATTQMIRGMSAGGGSLMKDPGGVQLIKGIYATWVKVNVIHDVSANKVETYINGTLATTGPGEAPSTWYHKYGCYGSLRTGNAKVEWRVVKHFTTERVGGSGVILWAARPGTQGPWLRGYDLTGRRMGPEAQGTKILFSPGAFAPALLSR